MGLKSKRTYQIDPLKGVENYEIWRIECEALLTREGLLKYVRIKDFGYSECVEGEQDNLIPDDKAEKAASIIKLNCLHGPLLQTQNIKKPYDLWFAFNNLYAPRGFNSEFLICRELFKTNLAKCNNNMEIYLNQVKRLNDQLIAKDIIIPEKVIFAWVLNNLSDNYETLITTITQAIRVNGSDSLKLDELFANLIDESKRVKSRSKKNQNSTEIALFIKGKKGEFKPYNKNKVNKSGNNPKFSIKCAHCHKKGHKIENCWIKNLTYTFQSITYKSYSRIFYD